MHTLATFIREHKPLIVDTWVTAVGQLPSAQHLSAPAIRDHVPELLDLLADAIERDDLSAVPLQGVPNVHAALRVREGYDLRQVVAEYRMLRRVIHELYADRGDLSQDSRLKMRSLRVMHAALDGAIADAVDQYAVERDRAREMFIGMLGHDLRDPLNAIAFGAQFLIDQHTGLPEPARKMAMRIARGATRMERMIADLLDFAHGRLGAGLPVVPVPLDARPLIVDTVQELAHAHPDRAIECQAACAPGDFNVRWDGDRIAQAIANLVSNALAHGGDPIVITPRDEGERIAIEVSNAGSLPPAVIPKLFEAFTHAGGERRADGTDYTGQERRRGHLGLGLYIVSEIARAHGGRVSADSNDGVTTFRLDLPRTGPMRSRVATHTTAGA